MLQILFAATLSWAAPDSISTLQEDGKGVLGTLAKYCNTDTEFKDINFMKIRYDGESEGPTIFNLGLEPTMIGRCLGACNEYRLHFLEVGPDKSVRYQSRKVRMSEDFKPQWIGKDGRPSEFSAEKAPDTGQFSKKAQGYKCTKSDPPTCSPSPTKEHLCEGMKKARENPEFQDFFAKETGGAGGESAADQAPILTRGIAPTRGAK